MLFKILTFANFSKSSKFYFTRREVLYFVTLDLFRYTSDVLHRRCTSTDHLVTVYHTCIFPDCGLQVQYNDNRVSFFHLIFEKFQHVFSKLHFRFLVLHLP